MSVPLPPLLPSVGDRGWVSEDPHALVERTVAAWDDLLACTDGIPLDAIGRKDGRTVARTLVVLGEWSEGRGLNHMRADALSGRLTAEELDSIEERVISAHHGLQPAQLRASLQRARDAIAAWGRSADLPVEALLPVAGPLGVVPLGTLVAASSYQCAVAALDLAPAGVRAPPSLLQAGLASLLDTVGAVSAQQRATLELTAVTPDGAVGTGCIGPSWRTALVEGDDVAGRPAIIGDCATILDVAAGRRFAPALYARGDLAVQQPGDLFGVAKVLAAAPSLPGAEGLQATVRAYQSTQQIVQSAQGVVTGAARRIGGLFGGRG